MQSTYFEPTTIVDAVEILDAEGIQAGVVAGGTDLVVANRMGKATTPQRSRGDSPHHGNAGHRCRNGREPAAGSTRHVRGY